MPKTEATADDIDWSLTTWKGARREQLRRWAELPLERVILAIEEMQELAVHANSDEDNTGEIRMNDQTQQELTATPLDLKTLQDSAQLAAAFRCRRRLQPAGGKGDKVFPPTFAGATYATEVRRVIHEDGTHESVPCVVLDTVQSQANRKEEALQAAVDRRRINLPIIEVDFTEADAMLEQPIGRITSLQVPHRLADAILRDSEYEDDGKRVAFRKSSVGEPINRANSLNATPLYHLCPTALVFGMWDSTGPKGGLGAKFQRALVSEIIGIGLADKDFETRHGVRNDPLGVRKAAQIVGDRKDWQVAEGKVKGSKSPSEVNHGNVPFGPEHGGVTIDHAEQTTTLSLIALRRLRFPVNGIDSDPEVDTAAQVVLAALGLCATALAAEKGMDLRSRCLLWPEEPMRWELLDRPGQPPREFDLPADAAIDLLNEAVSAAENKGLAWRRKPLRLLPSKQLVDLVRKSQTLARTEDLSGED